MNGPFALLVFGVLLFFSPLGNGSADPHVGIGRGSLVIQGGGEITNEVKERFVALAGGPEANFVVIPTALPDSQIDVEKVRVAFMRAFGVRNVAVLHTRDRVRANSAGFIEPLKHANGVWIEGGRQWRLVDAYLGTAVEREIKAVLSRGGVVGGGSAGATIQGSFLVRGAPGTRKNPDGDNSIMVAPGYTTGFGLLPASAIDQHVDARHREADLSPVIAEHPELIGIGIDQSAAIVVHGDAFFVVGGQVAIHDNKMHDGAPYFFLSSGEAFDLQTRTVEPEVSSPFTLTVSTASRSLAGHGIRTSGSGVLQQRNGTDSEQIRYECPVSMYSVGKNYYPAWREGKHQFTITTREVNAFKLQEYKCKY